MTALVADAGASCVAPPPRGRGRLGRVQSPSWESFCPVDTDDWRKKYPRRGAPWTMAEEKRLLELWAEATDTPMYYVATRLGRNPGACAGRYQQLMQCRKRMEAKMTGVHK